MFEFIRSVIIYHYSLSSFYKKRRFANQFHWFRTQIHQAMIRIHQNNAKEQLNWTQFEISAQNSFQFEVMFAVCADLNAETDSLWTIPKLAYTFWAVIIILFACLDEFSIRKVDYY